MGGHILLAQLTAYAGLLAATIEYCEIVNRRVAARKRAVDIEDAAEAGLRGVVRVFLADAEPDQVVVRDGIRTDATDTSRPG